MLVPILLTLPLGIMGLAMPPKETTTPEAAELEPREAPPKIEVMTMTCLMPGDDDMSSSSSSTDNWPPDSWTSTWNPNWPPTTSSLPWWSSSSTDDCWYWGDCSSTYTSPATSAYTCPWWDEDCITSSFSGFGTTTTSTSASSATAFQTCPWWDEDCISFSSSSLGGFGMTATSTSDWWPDPWMTITDSFATATSKITPSSLHRHPSPVSSSSSSSEEADAPSIVPIPTSLRHQPVPPVIEPLSPRKRAPPSAPGFFAGLFNRSPFGSGDDNSNNDIDDRVKSVSAIEKIATETIVIGVSTDGTPIYTSTEWGPDDSSSTSSSSSSSGSGSSSSSFWAAGGPSTTQPSVTTPAPQFVTVSSSSSLRCDDEFCSDGSSWCVYWAGITSWDASKGPVPGEKATTIGTC